MDETRGWLVSLPPDWTNYDCSVWGDTSGLYVVVDNGMQEAVYSGTKEECERIAGTSLVDDGHHRWTCVYCGQSNDMEDPCDCGLDNSSDRANVYRDNGFYTCPFHPDTIYWWEDGCPICAMEHSPENVRLAEQSMWEYEQRDLLLEDLIALSSGLKRDLLILFKSRGCKYVRQVCEMIYKREFKKHTLKKICNCTGEDGYSLPSTIVVYARTILQKKF